MEMDSLDELLSLEDHFYQEGHDLGITDGHHAGLVEGKIFGVEKGFEKALQMGRLSGRAYVWKVRSIGDSEESKAAVINWTLSGMRTEIPTPTSEKMKLLLQNLPQLPANSRLQKHLETILIITDVDSIDKENTDQAVANFDDRLARAGAKAKVIANIVGEALRVDDGTGVVNTSVTVGNSNIEEVSNLAVRK